MAKQRRTRTFQELLASYAAPVQQLAIAAQALIRKVLPDVEESVDTSGPYIHYGYGTGNKGMVATLIISQSGVKLAVVGADLPDPHGLLEGGGKTHRNVVLKAPPDLRRPGIRELLAAADRQAQSRLGRS